MIIDSIIVICFSFLLDITNCMKNKFESPSEVQINRFSNKNVNLFHNHIQLMSFEAVNPHYFGYWGLGMNGLGGSISSASDYSNLVFIREDTLEDLENKIRLAEHLNLQPIIMVQNIVFPWQQYSMYSDWQSRWDQFQSRIIINHNNSILGFYIFDEPFHNFDVGYTGIDKDAAAIRLNSQLTQLSNYIKLKNPDKIVALTYAYTEIEPYILKFSIPESVDWIGVNCYLDFGPACSEANVIKYYSLLNDTRKPHQNFMLTLDAYTSQSLCIVSESKQNAIIKRIDFILSWTQINIPVIALTPFLYQESHSATENLCGVSSMPLVADKLKAVAQKFVSKTSNQNSTQNLIDPPTTSTSVPTKSICASDDLVTINLLTGTEISRISSHPICVPKCESDDYVRRNEDGIEVDRWLSAPLCIPKCEGKDLVRRNEKKEITDIWINAPMCRHLSKTSV